MNVIITENAATMGQEAANLGAKAIRQAISERGRASIIVATGASQFETLAALVNADGIDWSRVVGFHLDEYIGLPADHRASFRGYLKKRFVDLVPIGAGPTKAISMSVKQILRSEVIVCSVPDERKAEAVANALEGPVTGEVPASILQTHGATTLLLDVASASRLTHKPGAD